MTTAKILSRYVNGDFTVTVYEDGTKTREGHGVATTPETMDVKITDWCDAACSWCHEKSTKAGLHGNLAKTIDLIKAMPRGTEIAIGGGHPLAHPMFQEFVQELSSAGIICNVTINEKHFAGELARLENLISDRLIYGVGYSYQSVPCMWRYEHLVTHVILGVTEVYELESVCSVNQKVLLLGYKTFGRGLGYSERHSLDISGNISAWYRGLFKAARIAHLSFDNLAIKQVKPSRLLSAETYEDFYMGEDGHHSMYLDAVKQQFAVSSTSSDRFPYEGSIADMFSNVRKLAVGHQ